MSYDNQWTITYDVSTYNVDKKTENGVFVGNGKVGIITTSDDTIDVQQTFITSQLRYANGVYKPNIIKTFNTNRIRFFENETDDPYVITTSQKLNMLNAIFTSYGVAYNNTSVAATPATFEYDLYAPQQFPFCIVQTIRIIPQTNMSELTLFHEVHADDHLVDVEYNNNVIFNEGTNGVHILTGSGKLRANGERVVCACTYVIENTPSYQPQGFNVYRQNLNTCYNKFKLFNLVANNTYKVHIITAHMSIFDFENPLEEVKRIVLNMINTGTPSTSTPEAIRTGHTNAWIDIWKTDVNIMPKFGISEQELQEIIKLKRTIRFSLYNIYSSIRENVSLEINPLNLSVIDIDGSIMYDGDIWLIPVLLMIKPDAARILLEYRHKMIDTARQLAAGYGFKGAKFPYINDSIGYKNALYWDVSGPMSIFNTALISINVWNYFRITKDREWLSSKGYPILKENADFFTSKVKKDPTTNTYVLENVVSLNSRQQSDQNSFTINMIRLALRYAIEASYELTLSIKKSWQECYHGLAMEYYPNPQNYQVPEIIKYDKHATPADTYRILEPLFVLLPYYNRLYFQPELNHTPISLYNNLEFYRQRLDPTVDHPYNTALITTLLAMYASYDTSSISMFKSKLYEFINTTTSQSIWGNMSSNLKGTNDIILNAIIIFIMLQGAGSVNISGGVAESRFYYEDMRLVFATSANLPNTWKSIRYNNLASSTSFNVVNAQFYMV